MTFRIIRRIMCIVSAERRGRGYRGTRFLSRLPTSLVTCEASNGSLEKIFRFPKPVCPAADKLWRLRHERNTDRRFVHVSDVMTAGTDHTAKEGMLASQTYLYNSFHVL